ncbi:sulfite exporter TauE/SafE family protein [Polaromonas sp. SP1]|nr:sulfite exporter TauE/SafE family protein [Polaromonas sp. SP1]QGJ17827.1 TSUP family transporter [Polaromonas sp. Pch-P]
MAKAAERYYSLSPQMRLPKMGAMNAAHIDSNTAAALTGPGHEVFILGVVVAVFLLAGLVKGVVGLGLPTLSMGLLASVMPPAHAAVILILPSFLTNAWQMWDGAALGRLVRRLWPLQLGVLAGTLWAPVSLVTLNANVASAGLGAALMVYAVLGLAAVSLSVPRRGERFSSGATGLITGAITAATGVFVFPAVPYLQALHLKKDELVQALGLSFTVSTVALFGRLALEGSFSADAVPGGWGWLAALPAALLGMAAGQMLRGRLDEKAFKRLFFTGLLAIGLYMVIGSAIRWLAG